MENNITYLFGAGASYNSCPIWKEQGDKMIDLAKVLGYNFVFDNEQEISKIQLDKIGQLARLVGEFGYKSKEFNTVDTYAKKLYLQKDYINLQKLKKSVSIFFTLWMLCDNMDWKQLPDSNGKNRKLTSIDPRYINLLATYLERNEPTPKLKSNIKFVTWNYDLQIEAAYSKFCEFGKNNFLGVDRYFPFIPKLYEDRKLTVCHLNGFHGFWGNENNENLFERSESRDLFELLRNFDFLNDQSSNRLAFNDYINYAWETDSKLSENARLKANEIFANTNTLVIVGYSFPPFNHVIDKGLFESAKNLKRVIFQDPKANTDILTETFGIPKNKIVLINNNMDQFTIPNFKEKINSTDVWA